MFILHVNLALKSGMAEVLKVTYQGVFYPAISKQPGFSETKLLRAKSSKERTYRLVIEFKSEEFQKKWVATDLHQQVWPQMEQAMAQYSVEYFETA
jgi:heme-degrading monooxygenase HmoA